MMGKFWRFLFSDEFSIKTWKNNITNIFPIFFNLNDPSTKVGKVKYQARLLFFFTHVESILLTLRLKSNHDISQTWSLIAVLLYLIMSFEKWSAFGIIDKDKQYWVRVKLTHWAQNYNLINSKTQNRNVFHIFLVLTYEKHLSGSFVEKHNNNPNAKVLQAPDEKSKSKSPILRNPQWWILLT